MLLTGGFMAVEVAGGLASGSLALLADAGHMLTDAAALSFAWIAFRLARRPADTRRSYGYHRFQILAAFVNGVVLMAIVAWIAFEALQRLREPVEVLGGLMLAVAGVGLAVNLLSFAILHGGNRENLNVRGALLHVASDLLGSLAAIIAAVVITEEHRGRRQEDFGQGPGTRPRWLFPSARTPGAANEFQLHDDVLHGVDGRFRQGRTDRY